MIHKYERYSDYGGMEERLRRDFVRGERLWKATCWVLSGLLAALLFAAQVH